ncbi:MAG: ABC transporter substrate-binding protein, partial [Longimicrobiales bacterium]|nr:ABC transporter substrate-binding protein [Longimicrobiales bacterium]
SPSIVSLIASATEIVDGLGYFNHLVGVSHECDHPEGVADLPRLSAPKVDPERPSAEIDRDVRRLVEDGLSVYAVDVELLQELAPDVIVTQDHCEVCAVSLSDVEDALCALDLPDTVVCSLHPRDLDDVREDIRKVAAVIGDPPAGERLVERIDGRLDALSRTTRDAQPPRVALIEWLAPPMVAGGWMPDLARAAGAEPIIVTDSKHFETVDWDRIAREDPDVVVVLPCGFELPRTLQEIEEPAVRAGLASVRAVREGRLLVLDGNAYFNRPGPRLADSAELLAAWLHPDLFPGHERRQPWGRWVELT